MTQARRLRPCFRAATAETVIGLLAVTGRRTEASKQAGGGACPIQFRYADCDHFAPTSSACPT